MLLVKSHKYTKSFAMTTIPAPDLPTPDRLKSNTLIVSKMLIILAAQMQQGCCVSG